MCLINLHLKGHPIYKFILAANRDEAYDRPTKEAHFWQDNPNLLAGRDLRLMGTWMGITKNGRFAALTNYRDPLRIQDDKRSRGEIIQNYLISSIDPEMYIKLIHQDREEYNGFNLLVGNIDELFYYSNISTDSHKLDPGTHSVSNHLLNTPWPKVKTAKQQLADYVRTKENIQAEELFKILANNEEAPVDQLPNTGVGKELEAKLSSIFIRTPHYGTRSSTVLLVDHHNHVTFMERTFVQGEFLKDVSFQFHITESLKV